MLIVTDRPNLKVTAQGKAVVENVNGDWLVMLPTGTVKFAPSKEEAFKLAERWFQRSAKRRGLAVGVGITEEH